MNEGQINALTGMAMKSAGAYAVRRFVVSQTGKAALRQIGLSATAASGTLGILYAGLIAYDIYQFWKATNEDGIPEPVPVAATAPRSADVNRILAQDINQQSQSKNASRCTLCKVDDSTIYCEQKNGHGFCHECFNGYALAAFKDLGSFCREVQSSNSITIISRIGELPCPFFERDNCLCSSIPLEVLDLTADAFNAFRRAERRIGAMEAAAVNERQRNTQNQQEQSTDINGLMIRAVQDILSVGASVRCPNCAYRGEKDDACMHIVCENCRCTWCYCCGRPRHTGSTNLCTTCDSRGSLIQSHPGWGNCRVERSEGPGYGALHEFHRKRMAYFLRRLVEGVPDLPWTDFWHRNSSLLSQVPTRNRSISQRDITNAAPPCIAPTTVTDLLWLNDCQPIIDSLREESRRHIGGGGNEVRQGNQSGSHANNQVSEEEIQAQIDRIMNETTMDPDLQITLLESLLQAQSSNNNNNNNRQQPRRRRFPFRLRNNR